MAKYTQDYSHLERCTPSLPDPYDQTTPLREVYKTLESPRQWFNSVSDSIPPVGSARNPDGQFKSQDFAPLTQSPKRERTFSRSSTLSKTQSHTENESSNLADLHISGSEPKAFPGVMHEREKRRNSTRYSVSGSVHEGSVASDRMSASQHMEPGMGKYRYNESEGMKNAEESD